MPGEKDDDEEEEGSVWNDTENAFQKSEGQKKSKLFDAPEKKESIPFCPFYFGCYVKNTYISRGHHFELVEGLQPGDGGLRG